MNRGLRIEMRFTILLLSCLTCHALTTNDVAVVVQAIYQAEGGDAAAYPYGVMSVTVTNKEQARQVCEESVTNSYARWEEAGRPACGHIRFMARRYCPFDQRNWTRNVKFFVRKISPGRS